MKIITCRSDIISLYNFILSENPTYNKEKFIRSVHTGLLRKKIKFPVLEYAAGLLLNTVPDKKQLSFLDKIISLDEIGSYVLAGKILQLRAEKYYSESINKACEYIISGDKWYSCDIISERVMGFSLLKYPIKTIPILRKLALNKNKWIVRSVGVAAHYAVKKGLDKNHTEKVFLLLIENAVTTDFHTKKGIGWGAKTIAKFHPELIKKHHDRIYKDPEVKQWFKTKIKIGLTYGKRDPV